MKDITDLLDEAARRMEKSGARGPLSMGNLAYCTEEDVALMRKAADYIRTLCGEPRLNIKPPPPMPHSPIIYTASHHQTR